MEPVKVEPVKLELRAMPVRILMRAYFSTYHWWAAQQFAAIAERIEENAGENSGFDIQHRAYVTNTIFSSVSFLESTINEIFQDASDSRTILEMRAKNGIESTSDDSFGHIPNNVKGLDSVDVALEIADNRNSFQPTIKKYNNALRIAGKPIFEESDELRQSVDHLIKLRNQLIHFNPETLRSDDLRPLDVKLRDQFPPNKMITSSGNPYFPDKCLGSGCCKWAVSSCKNFVDEFLTRMGLDSRDKNSEWPDPAASVDELCKKLSGRNE